MGVKRHDCSSPLLPDASIVPCIVRGSGPAFAWRGPGSVLEPGLIALGPGLGPTSHSATRCTTLRPGHRRSMPKGMWSVRSGLPGTAYTHLRAHETVLDLVCRLLLEKKK